MYYCDTEDAPWNEEEHPKEEVEIEVVVTLVKTVKAEVDDYIILDSGKDEDGNYFEDIDYSKCDLTSAVKEQVVLPHESWNYITPKSTKEINAIFNLKGWDVDNFEVVLN